MVKDTRSEPFRISRKLKMMIWKEKQVVTTGLDGLPKRQDTDRGVRQAGDLDRFGPLLRTFLSL